MSAVSEGELLEEILPSTDAVLSHIRIKLFIALVIPILVLSVLILLLSIAAGYG